MDDEKKNNLTLKDVSKALGYKSSQAYWKIENGKQEPTIAQTYKLAELYDIDSVIFLTTYSLKRLINK